MAAAAEAGAGATPASAKDPGAGPEGAGAGEGVDMEVESDPSLLEDVEEYHFDMDVEAEFSLGHSIQIGRASCRER